MKQIGRYSRFLYSIIFHRWSYYVSSILYLFVLSVVLFLISIVLEQPVSFTLTYFGFNIMAILAGSITAAVYVVRLFRAGIDDGTELLITSKPIKRSEMMVGKTIVLITLILILSILSMCLGFLTYFTIDGHKSYISVGIGSFLMTFIILLFFGSITLVFCLVTKNLGATLGTFGVSFSFMMVSIADTILSTSPASFVKTKKIDLQFLNPVKESDFKNITVDKNNNFSLKTTRGVIAKNNFGPLNNFNNNGDKIDYGYLSLVWKEALKKSNRYGIIKIDPALQWSQLLNIDNFNNLKMQYAYLIKKIFSSQNYFIPINLVFGNKKIDFKNEYSKISFNDRNLILLKNNSFSVEIFKDKLTLSNFVKENLSNNIYIPVYSDKNTQNIFQTKPTLKLEKLNIFKSSMSGTNNTNVWEEFNKIFFTDKHNIKNPSNTNLSINDIYEKMFEKLISLNLLSNLKPLNLISRIQMYLTTSFYDAIKTNKVEFEKYIAKKNIKINLKELNKINNITEYLKRLIAKDKDLINLMFFVNDISLNTLAQLQISAYNYLIKNSSNGQDTNGAKKNACEILRIFDFPTTVNSFSYFPLPDFILNKFLEGNKQFNNFKNFKELAQVISSLFIEFDNPPFVATDEFNLQSFNTVKAVSSIDLGGVISAWLIISLISFTIGFILYSKKDFI